jgi:hypothetical protein
VSHANIGKLTFAHDSKKRKETAETCICMSWGAKKESKYIKKEKDVQKHTYTCPRVQRREEKFKIKLKTHVHVSQGCKTGDGSLRVDGGAHKCMVGLDNRRWGSRMHGGGLRMHGGGSRMSGGV